MPFVRALGIEYESFSWMQNRDGIALPDTHPTVSREQEPDASFALTGDTWRPHKVGGRAADPPENRRPRHIEIDQTPIRAIAAVDQIQLKQAANQMIAKRFEPPGRLKIVSVECKSHRCIPKLKKNSGQALQ